MKLCFLGDANSIHFKRWIKYFANNKHEIHGISLEPISESDIKHFKNLKLYVIKKLRLRLFSPLNLIFNAIWVRSLIKKIKPDILHAHFAGVSGAIGALSGFHPFVLTPWGTDVLILPRSKIYRPMVKFALTRADLITCDGENTRQAMVNLGINSQKIKIICFGVDVDKFKPMENKEFTKRKLFGFDSKMVISLRNLKPIYDIETLIKAIPIVLKKMPDTKFVIAGEGEQKTYLIDLAKALNVFDAVKFIGSVPNDELPKYLNSADVYVSTSLSDSGLAASTAEAMACQLPVVITDSGGNREWVKDGENGFLVPIKSPVALAEKIIFLLKNEDIRKKFAEINRKIIEGKNNYFVEMAKVEDIYQKLIK